MDARTLSPSDDPCCLEPRRRRRATRGRLALCLAALLLTAAGSRAQAALVFGYVPGENSLLHSQEEASLLSDYLQGQLGDRVQPTPFPDSDKLFEGLRSGTVQFGVAANWLVPTRGEGLFLVANFTRSEKPTHDLVLLTSRASRIASLAELLARKPAVVVDELNPARLAFLAAQAKGDPEQAFRQIVPSNQGMKMLGSVLNGTFEAACLSSDLLDAVGRFDQGMMRQLNVLASQGPYASDAVVAAKTYPPDGVQRVRAALLQMEKDSVGEQVLLGLKMTKFLEPQQDMALYPAVGAAVAKAASPAAPAPPAPAAPAAKPAPPAPPPAPAAVAAPPTPPAKPAAPAPAPAPAAAKAAVPAPAAPTPVPAVVPVAPAPEGSPAALLEEYKRRAEADADAQRRRAYEEAKKLDTVQGYRVFLAVYPSAPERSEIEVRLRILEADDAAFTNAVGTEEGLEAYIALWPRGRHAEEARVRLEVIRSVRHDMDYQRAMAQPSPASLREFLERWPASAKAESVRSFLKSLEAQEKAPAAGKKR